MSSTFFEFTHKGAKVGVYPMKSVETVMIIVMIHAGSWSESGKSWGGLHLIEHLTLDATREFPSEAAIEEFKETHGINSNASTGGEYLEYWAAFPKTSLREGAKLLNQALFYPLMNEDDVKRENNVIRQEFTDKWSDPDTRFGRANNQQLYGKTHAYVRDGMGQPEYISTLTRDVLVKLHSKHFHPGNMSVSVVGNVTEKKARLAVDQLFEGATPKNSSVYKIAPVRTGSSYLFHKEDVDRVSIHLSFLLPGRDFMTRKQRLAVGIARYLLGGSARSILFRELRMKNGLVYRTGCGLSVKPTASELELWASTEEKSSQKVYDIMNTIIYRFIEDGVSDEDFSRAITFMNMQTLLAYDSVGRIAGDVVGSIFYEGKFIPPEETIKLANTITKKFMLAQLKEHISPGKELVAVMARKDPKLKI